jgi:hypothetical protein
VTFRLSSFVGRTSPISPSVPAYTQTRARARACEEGERGRGARKAVVREKRRIRRRKEER